MKARQVHVTKSQAAMPGMNGNDVARELRKIRTGAPIIFVTGYADADALSEADQGSIVPKLFNRSELTQALDRVLCRHDEPETTSDAV